MLESFSRRGKPIHGTLTPLNALLTRIHAISGPDPLRMTIPMQPLSLHGAAPSLEDELEKYKPFEATEQCPASPGPSYGKTPPAIPGVFHLTPPLKPQGVHHHFNFSATYGDPLDNDWGRGRVAYTTNLLEKQRWVGPQT